MTIHIPKVTTLKPLHEARSHHDEWLEVNYTAAFFAKAIAEGMASDPNIVAAAERFTRFGRPVQRYEKGVQVEEPEAVS